MRDPNPFYYLQFLTALTNPFANCLSIISSRSSVIQFKNILLYIFLEVSDDLLIAQGAVMLQGGFDTMASALTFLTYHLAHHPEMQVSLVFALSYLELLPIINTIKYRNRYFEIMYFASAETQSESWPLTTSSAKSAGSKSGDASHQRQGPLGRSGLHRSSGT